MKLTVGRATTSLAAAVIGALIATTSATAALGPPAVLHVGQIDRQDIAPQPGSEPDTLVEPDVAISPVNAGIAVAVAHDGRFPDGGAVDISYAWTHDAGAHWQHAPMPGLTTATGGRWDRASDPVVAFGPHGDVFISALVFDATNCKSGVTVSRSTDGGATFSGPAIVHSSASCNYSDDKDWLTIDTQPASQHYGRLYQFWTAFLTINGLPAGSPQVLRWSDDHGAHWSVTTVVSGPHDNAQDSQAMVEPDGTITDVYTKGGSLVAKTSRDGGATWGAAVKIAQSFQEGAGGIRCCLPAAAADPVTGRLYLVWEANGPGTTDPVELSTSADGRHWSAAHQVSQDGGSTTIENVNSTVTAFNGRVFVSYGTRDTAVGHGHFVQQQVSASYNNGKTFGAPISLGPPSDLRYAAFAGGKFPGDYIGASATRTEVVLVWCASSKPSNPAAKYHQTMYAAVLRP